MNWIKYFKNNNKIKCHSKGLCQAQGLCSAEGSLVKLSMIKLHPSDPTEIEVLGTLCLGIPGNPG